MSSPNFGDSCLNSSEIKVSSISECNEWRSTNADDGEKHLFSIFCLIKSWAGWPGSFVFSIPSSGKAKLCINVFENIQNLNS